MKAKELFFPVTPPTEQQMGKSRRILLKQGAIAAAMFSLGTGNFLAGYLAYLGASPAFIAQITAIPTLGCVLQMVSPFLFERLRYRKLAIIVTCFAFRFSMGFTVLAPFLFHGYGARLAFVFVLYLFSFLAAGFVTPALNQWVLQIGPLNGRGRYFAFKDIIATLLTALVSYGMARQLDLFTGKGTPLLGYVVVYGFCTVFSIVDVILMCTMHEPPSKPVSNMKWTDIWAPLKNPGFCPVLLFNILSYFSSFLSGPFLSVYQLQYLQLNHSFITAVGIVCSLVGMVGIWFWGRAADRTYWHVVVLCGGGITALCNLGWFLISPGTAKIMAPILMAVSAAGGAASGMAGLNMQYDASPQEGKTTYLGVTAAMASLTGYGSAMLGSLVQRWLQFSMGLGSMRVLFLMSSICAVSTLLYGLRRLPKQKPA
jgi:MFS family permease